MPRVGNDHEELHNSKLAPDGYYNGFHFKDYNGNYVQQQKKVMRQKKHHHHHPRQFVQYNHSNDEDDFLLDSELKSVERREGVDENSYMQFEHENDTQDIDGEQPGEVVLRGSARQRIQEDEQWNKFFAQKPAENYEESQWDQANVQLSDRFLTRKAGRGEPFVYESELVQNKEDNTL